MKNGNITKFVFIVVIFIVVFLNFSSVYAELNGTYGTKATSPITAGTVDINVKNNPMLQTIGALVYFVGNALVSVLSTLSLWIMGTDIFPWADMILYNAIPFLDINFIKPNSNSLVFEISEVIRNVYFTILSISIAFFAVAVLVMAVKLVTSTLASQKARYKEAITNWLIGLVLLFTVHYFISFIFFLNENLVVMASEIAGEKLEGFNITSENVDAGVSNLKDKLKNNGSDNAKKLYEYFSTPKGEKFLKSFITYAQETYNQNKDYNILTIFGFPSSSIGGFMSGLDGVVEYFNKDQGTVDALARVVSTMEKYKDNTNYSNISWMKEVSDSFDIAKKDMPSDIKISGDKRYDEDYLSWYICDDGIIKSQYPQYYQKCIDGYAHKDIYLKYFRTDPLDATPDQYGTTNKIGEFMQNEPDLAGSILPLGPTLDLTNFKTMRMYYNLIDIYRTNSGLSNEGKEDQGSSTDQKTPIGMLSEYFRTSSLSVDTGKLVATKISFENSVMYTILVAQSVMYFFVYIKRFFYVIILSLMAPIIVVYDFFKKTTS